MTAKTLNTGTLRPTEPRLERRLVARPDVPAGLLTELAGLLSRPGGGAKEFRQRAGELRRQGEHIGRALFSLVADLHGQGWTIEITAEGLSLSPTVAHRQGEESIEAVKHRLRAALLNARAAQLADPAVRSFLQGMEQRRLFQGRRVSVLDLVDDGTSLARALAEAATAPVEQRDAALARHIDPVLVTAAPGQPCPTTGLDLMDVWRYFRHTWSLEYRATPGRALFLLIRNAARPNAPVMGLVALASALPQLGLREAWIGWTLDEFLSRIRLTPEEWNPHREALLSTLLQAQGELRTDDLLSRMTGLSGVNLERSLVELSRAAEIERQAQLRERLRRMEIGEDVESLRPVLLSDGLVDWRRASETPLFTRKRARLFADLLFARRVLEGTSHSGLKFLDEATSSPALRRAVSIGLREIRKVGLASRVLDVNVCGAIPPYGPLLGGKLAALAVGASEVTAAYARRYANQVSEIASQVAGREIRRSAELCALTTTSLYGVASSQYNRLRLNVPLEGSIAQVQWHELGLTEGYGTVHLGEETARALRDAAIARSGLRAINNVFGEGNSPRLRQIREGLEALHIPPDHVLQHSSPKRVYGLALSAKALEALRLNAPHRASLPSFTALASAWRLRWLQGRVTSQSVLSQVSREGPTTVLERLQDTSHPQLSLF